MTEEEAVKRFKPTKWSIRLFRAAIYAMPLTERTNLYSALKKALRHKKDVQTIRFLDAAALTLEKSLFAPGAARRSFSNERLVIEVFITMLESGYLQTTQNELIRQMKRAFNIRLSNAAILDIMKKSKGLRRYRITIQEIQ
jgi:hypothetical protein